MKPIPPEQREQKQREAAALFAEAWNRLEAEVGRENMIFPADILLLGGAPGSGKSTHARFILRTRGMACGPLIVSDLLSSPEARQIKAAGGMVGDGEVLGLVLRALLRGEFRDGVIVDGFPRTRVQVQCFRLLVEAMERLAREYQGTPLAGRFRRPKVGILILYITEAVSVDRQLQRGREIAAHNLRVRETGIGTEQELRPTDLDETRAHIRYRNFAEQTRPALESLQDAFEYHLVDGDGEIEQVDQRILRELRLDAGPGGGTA